MPPKRLRSDRSDKDTDKDVREAKKRKTLPHRGKIQEVIQQFLDMLSPATSESLARFNEREIDKNRDGVVPIDIDLLEMDLGKLLGVTDTKSLDVKLNEISSSLDVAQDHYDEYMVDAAAKNVTMVLRNLIQRIEVAKEQLPGIFFTG